MSRDFDSYLEWLDIPTAEQPPNHYRLLALNLFESNHAVIDAAADRVVEQVHQRSEGAQQSLVHKLLFEISNARACLLDVDGGKAQYDAELQGRNCGPRNEMPVAPPPPPSLKTPPKTAETKPLPKGATGELLVTPPPPPGASSQVVNPANVQPTAPIPTQPTPNPSTAQPTQPSTSGTPYPAQPVQGVAPGAPWGAQPSQPAAPASPYGAHPAAAPPFPAQPVQGGAPGVPWGAQPVQPAAPDSPYGTHPAAAPGTPFPGPLVQGVAPGTPFGAQPATGAYYAPQPTQALTPYPGQPVPTPTTPAGPQAANLKEEDEPIGVSTKRSRRRRSRNMDVMIGLAIFTLLASILGSYAIFRLVMQ